MKKMNFVAKPYSTVHKIRSDPTPSGTNTGHNMTLTDAKGKIAVSSYYNQAIYSSHVLTHALYIVHSNSV